MNWFWRCKIHWVYKHANTKITVNVVHLRNKCKSPIWPYIFYVCILSCQISLKQRRNIVRCICFCKVPGDLARTDSWSGIHHDHDWSRFAPCRLPESTEVVFFLRKIKKNIISIETGSGGTFSRQIPLCMELVARVSRLCSIIMSRVMIKSRSYKRVWKIMNVYDISWM